MPAPINLVLADPTQPGFLSKLSGNATDFLDGTGNWQDIINATYGHRRQLIFYDDFLYYFTTANASTATTINGVWWAYAANSPTGIVANTTGVGADIFNKAWGVWTTNLSTPTTGVSGCYLPQGFMPGLGPLDIFFRVAFPIIPTTTIDNATCYFGLTGLSAGAPVPATNAIVLAAFLAAGTNFWYGSCVSGGVTSNTPGQANFPTLVPVSNTALTFYNLQISINAAWNVVSFFVNGTPLGQNNIPTGIVSANIPSAVILSPIAYAAKGTGTTTGYGFHIDKCFMRYQMGGV